MKSKDFQKLKELKNDSLFFVLDKLLCKSKKILLLI